MIVVNKNKSSVKRSSQGPLTIWHGVDLPRLYKLFSLKPPVSIKRIGRLSTLPFFASYNSLMKLVEAATHGRAVAKTDVHPAPLFVVGHWRSGTTLLHNLLCQDKQFGFPNLYECLFPHHFLLTESVATPLTSWMLPKSRPMDNVPCGWDLPQEDEIAICMLSLLGPYRMMAMLEQPAKYDDMFEPGDMRPDERQQLRDTILYFMKKLSVRYRDAAGKPKPLCMKSPSHTFRVAELADMFPQARFLYIHRHPYDVFNSTVHLRRTMWDENGFAPAKLDTVRERAIGVYMRAINAYERDKVSVADGQLHEIRYEDLASDPVGQLRATYEALGFDGFGELEKTLEPQVPKLTSYKRNKFEMDEETQRFVYENAKAAFDLYGYESHLDDSAVA